MSWDRSEQRVLLLGRGGMLDLTKTGGCVGPPRPWRENLADVVARLPLVVA